MKKVNRHLARIFAIVLSAIMLVSNTGAIETKAASVAFKPANVNDTFVYLDPGKTIHVSIPVDAGIYSYWIYNLDAETENSLISAKNIRILSSDGSEASLMYGFPVSAGSRYIIDFDLVSDTGLKIGNNTITIRGFGYAPGDDSLETGYFDLITITTYTGTELLNPEIVVSNVSFSQDPIPGTKTTITVTLKNIGDITSINNFVNVALDDSVMIPGYATSRIKVSDMSAGGTTRLELPVEILPTATPGLKTIRLSFSGKTKAGDAIDCPEQILYVTIKEGKKTDQNESPAISVATDDNYTEITPETEDSIKLTLKNDGSATASDIKVEVVSGFEAAGGITKNYTTDSIAVENIKSGKSKKVEIPFVVSKNVASGLHEITLKVSYSSASGKEFSENITVYLFVSPEKGKNTDDVKNNIYIKNVTQTPASPKAGEKVTVSFDIVNDGKTAVDNFKIAGSGLSSSGFEPLTNDPYAAVGSIAAGATKHVNVSFKCGKRISEGMNTLGLTFTYTDANDEQQTVNESVYVLNVIADADAVDVGRPKLIVSDYGTDQDILKAGNTFMFNFTLKNTHAVKAAKNIKITLSQNEGIFEPAQGTNIFYIDEIKAGTTSSLEIELKTRVDAITGDYPIVLLVEYEYDDMSDVDKEKGGVSEENTIKLRAIENYRPVIQNVAIDGWAGVNVNEAVDLNFEFYNMGKSVLGNVFVTVEGDFMLANNSTMSYVGAVQGYSSEYVTLSVVPTVGGEATGTLTVHFEDSNGDEVTTSQDFTQYVNDNGGFDPGMDPGFDPGMDPGFDPGMDPGLEPGDEGEAKKILGMPKWLFFTVCGVVAAGAVTGGIVIAKKKKNKVKDIDDEDY